MILRFTQWFCMFLVFCCLALCMFVEFRILSWFIDWVNPHSISEKLLATVMVLPLWVLLTVVALAVTSFFFLFLDRLIVEPVKERFAKRKP